MAFDKYGGAVLTNDLLLLAWVLNDDKDIMALQLVAQHATRKHDECDRTGRDMRSVRRHTSLPSLSTRGTDCS